MRRSLLVPALTASVLLVAGAPAVAASTAAHHPRPAPVSRVHAFDGRHAVTLDWVDPDRHFDHLVVRVRRGSDAPRFVDGRYEGRRVHVGHHATSARLTRLRRNTVYSASVWTVNAHGIPSAARHTQFTSDDGTGRGRLAARFTDASGHPLADVTADVESELTGTLHTATSGRDGRISLDLPAGPYLVDADGANATGGTSDATGYVGTTRVVVVRPGRAATARSIRLTPGAAVRVRVVDTSGRPVRGVLPELAPVSAYVQTDADDGLSFESFFSVGASTPDERTDAAGDATLRGVAPSGALQVCVNPYSDPFGDADSAFLSACTESSTLPRAGFTVSAGTLAITRVAGGSVGGRVRNRAGHGFADSLVLAIRGRHLVGAAYTSAGGAFRIGGLRPGSYHVCAAAGAFSSAGRTGYLPGCDTHPVTITSTNNPTTSLVLHTAAAATGTVTGPQGIPIAGADVVFPHAPFAGAVTDSKGHFLAKGLDAGRQTLCVEVADRAPTKRLPFGVRSRCGRKHHLQFTARIGRTRTGLDVHLPVGGAVSGTVRDRAGRPVPSAEVLAIRKAKGLDIVTTTADQHGRFTLTGLRHDMYAVCAVRESASDSADFTALRRAALRGGGGGSSGGSSVPVACSHRLVAARTGHLVRGPRLVLPTSSAITVRVLDTHGRAVAGVDAAALTSCFACSETSTPLLPDTKNETIASSATDAHGSAVLDDLRPGTYAVCLFAFYGTTRAGAPSTGYADRCSGSGFTVRVRSGHTTTERLVLQPGGAVSGRITDANGNPLKGVRVHVAGSAADDLPQLDTEFGDLFGSEFGAASATPGFYSTTGSDGTYTVRSVRPGKRLVCTDPTGATGGSSSSGYVAQCVGGPVGSTRQGSPVTVTSAATTGGVDLALAPAGSITGKVTTRLADAETSVVLFRGKKFVDGREPAKSGFYRFVGLSPGTYTVCAAAFGRKTELGRCYRDVAFDPRTATGPPSAANPVQVSSGAVTSGIDIVIPR